MRDWAKIAMLGGWLMIFVMPSFWVALAGLILVAAFVNAGPRVGDADFERPGYVYSDYVTSDGRVISGVPQWTMRGCVWLSQKALDRSYAVIVTAPYDVPSAGIARGEKLRIVGIRCRVSGEEV